MRGTGAGERLDSDGEIKGYRPAGLAAAAAVSSTWADAGGGETGERGTAGTPERARAAARSLWAARMAASCGRSRSARSRSCACRQRRGVGVASAEDGREHAWRDECKRGREQAWRDAGLQLLGGRIGEWFWTMSLLMDNELKAMRLTDMAMRLTKCSRQCV